MLSYEFFFSITILGGHDIDLTIQYSLYLTIKLKYSAKYILSYHLLQARLHEDYLRSSAGWRVNPTSAEKIEKSTLLVGATVAQPPN